MTALYDDTAAETTTATEREPFIEHCPNCVGNTNIRPLYVAITPDDGARCDYRCPDCGYAWVTNWGTYGEDPKWLWTGPR